MIAEQLYDRLDNDDGGGVGLIHLKSSLIDFYGHFDLTQAWIILKEVLMNIRLKMAD